MRVLLVTTDIDHIEPHQYVGAKAKGAEVSVICERGARNLEIFSNAGIHVEQIEFGGRRHAKTISTIREIVRKYSPDIVHVLRKKALSNTIPALMHSEAKLIAYRGIVGNLSFLDPISWMTFLNPRVDRIVCVAEAIRRHFLRMGFGPLRLSPEKVITIHKGHRTEKYREVEKVDLTSYGIPPTDKVIACTGAMRARKGVHLLVEAFSRMSCENTSLLLVGEIRDPRINKAIQKSTRRNKIFTLGNVPQPEALAIAGSVDVIVMPSTKREGLPRALIEAMAQGTPAVVTDIGGSPELVEDGISGYVVPPGNVGALSTALDKIVANTQLTDMGENARQRIEEHFHVSQTVEKNWALYNELLASSS